MMDSLLAWLASHADKMPFLMGSTGAGVKWTLSPQRIIEALIIGAVLTLGGYIAVIPRLEERITLENRAVREAVAEVKEKVNEIDRDRQRDYRELMEKVNQIQRTSK